MALGAIVLEAIRRLGAPEPVAERSVIVVAAIAAVVNGASALAFMRGGKRDLNVRAAFLHLAGDAAISVVVVVAGIVIFARAGFGSTLR